MDDMRRLAEACRKAGIRLVVVATPCHRSFLEETTERGMAEMRECVEAMRGACPGMEYYDFMDDPRFAEDDFFNSSHLAEGGAEKFSKMLRDALGL